MKKLEPDESELVTQALFIAEGQLVGTYACLFDRTKSKTVLHPLRSIDFDSALLRFGTLPALKTVEGGRVALNLSKIEGFYLDDKETLEISFLIGDAHRVRIELQCAEQTGQIWDAAVRTQQAVAHYLNEDLAHDTTGRKYRELSKYVDDTLGPLPPDKARQIRKALELPSSHALN